MKFKEILVSCIYAVISHRLHLFLILFKQEKKRESLFFSFFFYRKLLVVEFFQAVKRELEAEEAKWIRRQLGTKVEKND